jgi:EAL domain-containing protein (putative c-di-GMP-specific phosphodiesterase class I)
MARLAADLPQVPVAVNLSGLQFRQKNLLDVITRIVKETSVPPGMLELEITESTIMHEESHAIRSMIQLKELGFGLSIDDFGTGYSSLSHLKNFPVDILKIDRSFIRDIADNVDDLAIATAIINMAHCLNLKVVAEGVENSQQLKLLRVNGCDEVQGFFFFEPLSKSEFLHLQDEIGMQPNLRLSENRSGHKVFPIRQPRPELAALSGPVHPGQKVWEGLCSRSGSRRAGP